MYRKSLDDPQAFWESYAGELHWVQGWNSVIEDDFDHARVKWFVGGKAQCL